MPQESDSSFLEEDEILRHNADILWFHLEEPLVSLDGLKLTIIPRHHLFTRFFYFICDPMGKKTERAIVKTFQIMGEKINQKISDFIELQCDIKDIQGGKKPNVILRGSYGRCNSEGVEVVMNIWKVPYSEIALGVTCHPRFSYSSVIEYEALLLRYLTIKRKFINE